MSVLGRLRSLLGAGTPGSGHGRAYDVAVRCQRCGEILTSRIDLHNDLSIDYENGTYHVRKLIIGSGQNRCFQRIEITLRFNPQRQLLERQISGGTFVEDTEIKEDPGNA